KDGRTLRGAARNESPFDLQMQDLDGGLHLLTADEITSVVHEPKSLMPVVEANDAERRDLLAFLTRLGTTEAVALPPSSGGRTQGGIIFSEIAAPRPGDWPSYHGHLSGNRHSPLRQIDTGNVANLAPRWLFRVPDGRTLEMTPVVVDGVMYVTTVNQAWALDARSGRQIWHFTRARTSGVIGDAGSGINRGVAVPGNLVF